MSIFEADNHHSVEGVDTFNACYGGTNALFSTVNWIRCLSWNGLCGTVICSDPAVHPDPAHLPGIGAAAISMFLMPDACYAME